MKGGEAVGHELRGYGQKHSGKVVEVQAGGKAADDSQEKAEDDAGEEGEVDHLTYLQKSISTYRYILFLSP
jgi:hypothetical protein